jgi:hypothetical protein
VRARDDADLSGAILNPFCAIKISLFLRNAHQSLSLFLSSLKGFKARGRGTRERRARCCFGEEDFVANVSLFERSSSNFFSHQIIISLEQKRTHFSLERERKCLACCKMRDTKSTPKLLHANKKIKRD